MPGKPSGQNVKWKLGMIAFLEEVVKEVRNPTSTMRC